MFLEYLALAILLFGLLLLFYAFIYIHDIPYRIAVKRDHPDKEAIHVACWLSLFTLHAIWPIVFIWAVSHRTSIPVKLVSEGAASGEEVLELSRTVEALQERIRQLEGASDAPGEEA